MNYRNKPNHVQMLTISQIEKRNIFIASLLPELLNENRKIYFNRVIRDKFFYETEDFLKSHHLEEITFGKYIGGMKERALEDHRNVIYYLNFNMIEEGFDCKELDTLIMATPKTDAEQVSGRILRLKPEDRIRPPLIIDIWIFFEFQNKGLLRMKYYKKRLFI